MHVTRLRKRLLPFREKRVPSHLSSRPSANYATIKVLLIYLLLVGLSVGGLLLISILH